MNSDDIDELAKSLNAWKDGMFNLAECIVWFQHIENTLCICISAFARMDEQIGEIVTSEMSFRSKVSILSALATNESGENGLHEDIKELLKKVRWAEQERNRVVHSIWDLSEEKPGTIQREKAAIRNNQHIIVEENYLPEDLEELKELFEGINTDLIYLFSKYYPNIEDKLHY
jgi:hypothetical protein